MARSAHYIGAVAAVAMAILAGLYFKSGDSKTVTKATAKEIQEVLANHPEDVLRQIALENVEVSFPADREAPRVLVRVEKGNSGKVPKSIMVEHSSRTIEIPLEASETYEPYRAQ